MPRVAKATLAMTVWGGCSGCHNEIATAFLSPCNDKPYNRNNKKNTSLLTTSLIYSHPTLPHSHITYPKKPPKTHHHTPTPPTPQKNPLHHIHTLTYPHPTLPHSHIAPKTPPHSHTPTPLTSQKTHYTTSTHSHIPIQHSHTHTSPTQKSPKNTHTTYKTPHYQPPPLPDTPSNHSPHQYYQIIIQIY